MPDSVAGPPVPSPRATGADLPGELVVHILQFSLEPLGEHRPYSIILRQFLPLALVCRDFANVCRPRLYRRLVLDSDKQLKRLTNLASSSSSFGWLLLLTKTLTIRIPHMHNDAFWVHRIFTVFIPRIVHAQCVHPFLDVKIYTSRSIPGLILDQTTLPRPIPPSLLQHITSLELSNHSFRGGDDLLQCLSSFGALEMIELSSCTCQADATPTAVRRFTVKPSPLKRFYCTDSVTCLPMALVAILSAGMHQAHFTWCLLEEGEYQTLLDMIVSLGTTCFPRCLQFRATIGDCPLEIEISSVWNFVGTKCPGTFFRMSLVPIWEEMYNFKMTVVAPVNVLNSTSLVDSWRKLASCTPDLRHLKGLSLWIPPPDENHEEDTTEIMVALRPVMQDLYASLSPRQCLFVDPPNPPGLFENEGDYALYPYLERIPYPEGVMMAAMKQKNKKEEQDRCFFGSPGG